jgi:predicted GIY-YIG superfamily endonuclease
MNWWVYMIEADDGSLYTGVTTDIARRFREHCGSRVGARFFAGRQPLGVVFLELQPGRGPALQREAAIKKLKRPEKLKLRQQALYYR